MSEFTKGKWNFLEWPISPDQEEKQKYLIGSPERAIGFVFHKADARLIATAPKLYELVMDELRGESGGILSFARESKIRRVIDYIAGKDIGHDEQPSQQR